MWDTAWELIKVTLLFALVLGLAFLSTRFLGTRFGGMHARGRHMRILEQVVVGRDRSLLLVEVAGQVHLLGATPDSIRLLSTVDDPLMVEAILQQEMTPPTDGGSLPEAIRRMPESFRTTLERFRRQEMSDSADSPQQQSAESQIREQIDRLRRLTKQ